MGQQWRAEFDAEVTFSNGGDLRARGFRLDIPDSDIDDAALADLFVAHLGLLMVGEVAISNKRLIREPHKGSRGVPRAPEPERRVVELSHVIEDGMITYPGLPAPVIDDHLSRADAPSVYGPGSQTHIGRIQMVANTGTYLDAPSHWRADGADVADLPVDRTADLNGIVVRVTDHDHRAIDRTVLAGHDVTGKAVLIHTGWDRHWGTDQYFHDHPHLTADAVGWLIDAGARLVGIDSLNLDGTAGRDRPGHQGLLGAGIPIVEHLCGLAELPPHGFRFHAAPAPVRDMGTFPVRAYAVIAQ